MFKAGIIAVERHADKAGYFMSLVHADLGIAKR